jgi:DNA-binding transcriptional ArsR family regulator
MDAKRTRRVAPQGRNLRGLSEREKVLKALANKRRLALLRELHTTKELPVGELAGRIRLSFAATSRHLNQLYAAGLVTREQRGLLMYYRIADRTAPLLRAALVDLYSEI